MSMARDLFEVLGVGEPTFRVDAKALEAAYRAAQFALHPDRFASASAQERGVSEAVSSLVNAAYSTLRDPLARARYLLRLRGVETETEVRGAGGGGGRDAPAPTRWD